MSETSQVITQVSSSSKGAQNRAWASGDLMAGEEVVSDGGCSGGMEKVMEGKDCVWDVGACMRFVKYLILSIYFYLYKVIYTKDVHK